MDEIRIVDRGNGWVVEAMWFGEMRAVFSSDPTHGPLIQLHDCWDYVRVEWPTHDLASR